jgi:hypothetical protein
VALELAAADPPPLRAGDVADVLPAIAGSLPAGQPRVVFHAATRLHVPAGRRAAFDAPALRLRRPGQAAAQTIAIVDGHLRWIEMCAPPR